MADSPGVLSPRQVAGLLRAGAAAIQTELAALPDDVLRFHPAPGEWCAKEVLGHLIEAERRGFTGRVRLLIAQRDPKLQGWDQDAVARERKDCQRDARALLDEFLALREDSVKVVTGLIRDDLPRGGHHPRVGYLTVGDVIQEWVYHDRNHLKQILANVQAYVWPAMGAAQRFSAPAPPPA
jgi:hypothetical protein